MLIRNVLFIEQLKESHLTQFIYLSDMVRYLFCLSIVLSAFACSTNQVVSLASDLTLYHGGPILTMEGDAPSYVESVVFSNDAILFAGDIKTAQQSYPNAASLDLEGKVIMPGFIEPHVHPSIASTVLPNEIIAPHDWSLPSGVQKGVKTKSAYRQRLTKALEGHSKDQIFLTWGYHQLWHGALSRQELNQLVGDQPVGIIHRSFHEFYVNDAAIKLLGLQEQDYVQHPQVNWDKGHFYEGGWMAVVPKIAPALFNPMKLSKGMATMRQLVLDNGITTIAEPGFPSTNFFFEYGLYKQALEAAPFDVFLIPNGTRLYHSQGGNQEALSFVDSIQMYNTRQLKFLPKQIKLFADGAIYSQLMQMKEGYTDGHEGEWMTPLQLLENQIKFYWSNNYKIHVHANGDLGIQELIDMVDPLYKEKPYDHRFTLHHMGYFTSDQADQMADLKMEASVNPFYLWALSDKYSEFGLGEERSESLVRTNSLVERDIPISFHSDFSMAPLSPLTLAWVAVNRVTAGGNKVSQEERVSPYQAMRAITIDAARTLNLEESIGSIKVGKRANFVILQSDPLKVEPMAIKDVKVVGTVFNGEDVSHLGFKRR